MDFNHPDFLRAGGWGDLGCISFKTKIRTVLDKSGCLVTLPKEALHTAWKMLVKVNNFGVLEIEKQRLLPS